MQIGQRNSRDAKRRDIALQRFDLCPAGGMKDARNPCAVPFGVLATMRVGHNSCCKKRGLPIEKLGKQK